MLIAPTADRAAYKQLADIIRAQIHSGEFRPEQRDDVDIEFVCDHDLLR